jgi:hypothetical protein
MTTWVKCKSSVEKGVVVWVNLTLAQTMHWETSRAHTVIRFSPGADDAIEVAERPEELLKRRGKSGTKAGSAQPT